jgi:hypothetical protein
MSDPDVRIVKLEPFRYASSYGFGATPEGQAWDRILAFAERRGYRLNEHRFFGFDNPSSGSQQIRKPSRRTGSA